MHIRIASRGAVVAWANMREDSFGRLRRTSFPTVHLGMDWRWNQGPFTPGSYSMQRLQYAEFRTCM